MPKNSQAINNKNIQKDPNFPQGFTKVDHNNVSIFEILDSFEGQTKPDWVAHLHHDFELNAGTLNTRSLNYFVTCWGWGHRRVKRFFEARRTIAELMQRTCRENDESKPSNGAGSGGQATEKRQESDGKATESCRQLNKEKEEEQEKEKRVDKSTPKKITLPEWLPMEAWLDFVEHRKALKSPLTAKAAELAIKDLGKFRQSGNDPVEVINRSILQGWKGLFELPDQKPKGHGPSGGGGHMTAAERIKAKNAEDMRRLENGEVLF